MRPLVFSFELHGFVEKELEGLGHAVEAFVGEELEDVVECGRFSSVGHGSSPFELVEQREHESNSGPPFKPNYAPPMHQTIVTGDCAFTERMLHQQEFSSTTGSHRSRNVQPHWTGTS